MVRENHCVWGGYNKKAVEGERMVLKNHGSSGITRPQVRGGGMVLENHWPRVSNGAESMRDSKREKQLKPYGSASSGTEKGSANKC